jgi:hypothetical protein
MNKIYFSLIFLASTNLQTLQASEQQKKYLEIFHNEAEKIFQSLPDITLKNAPGSIQKEVKDLVCTKSTSRIYSSKYSCHFSYVSESNETEKLSIEEKEAKLVYLNLPKELSVENSPRLTKATPLLACMSFPAMGEGPFYKCYAQPLEE